MLIECKECGLPVSNKAPFCPHCGIPLTDKPIRPYTSKKRKRLPNGFGQITKLTKKNLRKPYRAMVTVGKTAEGKPICKLLKPEAYFETYNDAYMALMEYNKNPYDLDKDITIEQLHEQWFEKYKQNGITPSRINAVEQAWSYSSSVKNLKVSELKAFHIKNIMNNGYKKVYSDDKHPIPPSVKPQIKVLFSLMLDYAVEYELVNRNVARDLKIPKNITDEVNANKKGHISFTKEEIDTLWDNSTDDIVSMILYQCYSGWRPQEICNLKLADVDLDNGIIYGGLKTDAGKNRPVPIHSKVRSIIEKRYDEALENGSEYLFFSYNFLEKQNCKYSYEKYKRLFKRTISKLGLNLQHLPHDPRKQFITMAKRAGVDEYAIKYIVGHSIRDLTEKVYTERDIEWLKTEMEKIKE